MGTPGRAVLGADWGNGRINPLSAVVPGATHFTDLGAADKRWGDVYASGADFRNSISVGYDVSAQTGTFSGIVPASNVSASSDGRIKSNQQPILNGLGTLMSLRPKTYFKHQNHFAEGALVLDVQGTEEAGFIAQERYEVLPMAAHRPADESKGIWTVSYNQVIPYAVKAVQELKAENDSLRATIEAQKTRLETLERQMVDVLARLGTR